MGRTNRTIRDGIRGVEHEWEDYSWALKREDQAHFGRLFDHARNYVDAGGARNPLDPVPAILFSIVLTQQRKQSELEERNKTLEGSRE